MMTLKKWTVGHICEIDEKCARVIEIEGKEIALFHLSDGSIKAIENRCPHKGGKLAEGIVCDTHVYCPLHDWKISLETGRAQAPDEGCTATYPVLLSPDGEISLLLPDKNDSEFYKE
jgi:nitrite reductase (NADH) small subunit